MNSQQFIQQTSSIFHVTQALTKTKSWYFPLGSIFLYALTQLNKNILKFPGDHSSLCTLENKGNNLMDSFIAYFQ